jgi:thiamine phosphate synthase YjbQ (UPF0047 family)
MTVHHDKLEIRTHAKGTYEITDVVQEKADKSRIDTGIVTVFVQHTSCSLTMMENAATGGPSRCGEVFRRSCAGERQL